MNQYRFTAKGSLKHKLQRNLKQTVGFLFQENIFENVVSRMLVILFMGECVKVLG